MIFWSKAGGKMDLEHRGITTLGEAFNAVNSLEREGNLIWEKSEIGDLPSDWIATELANILDQIWTQVDEEIDKLL